MRTELPELLAIDSHCHADIMNSLVPEFFDTYHRMRVGGISWSYVEGIKSYRHYPEYWNRLKELCQRLRQQGLFFYYLVGIHPRCIPPDLDGTSGLPREVTESMLEHLSSPLCLGIGEIGIDTGSEREERIFRLQLEWAEEQVVPGKRVGIHTPRQNKKDITRRILDILSYYEPLHPFTVIDHVTPETFPYVHEQGLVAGLTLQEGKCSKKDLITMLERHGDALKGLMLNSDGARSISKPFFDFICDRSFPDEELKKGLLRDHCLNFFAIRDR
ncbi:TatD family hydrolase [Thermodesulforhabdus norvegica]|uniref:TatD DNase family protein n=1 Tax=Thermodesulforhabdus norvegica TaxID=39841 RepID=A0A1I4QJV6_9BACT|nr:TatD family hydrolase [Thermodesulforhabdus norvegica]SFM40349.1 hypothetical protein SAMN05660836_00076 [Thermodesulforhabdus norvegica]